MYRMLVWHVFCKYLNVQIFKSKISIKATCMDDEGLRKKKRERDRAKRAAETKK